MNKVINYLKSISLFVIIFIIYLILISIFTYFEILPFKTIGIIKYIAILLLFFILGYKSANLEGRKGYLNGFLISSILITVFLITTLITYKIDLSQLIYFFTLITSSVTGGIIGVRKK